MKICSRQSLILRPARFYISIVIEGQQRILQKLLPDRIECAHKLIDKFCLPCFICSCVGDQKLLRAVLIHITDGKFIFRDICVCQKSIAFFIRKQMIKIDIIEYGMISALCLFRKTADGFFCPGVLRPALRLFLLRLCAARLFLFPCAVRFFLCRCAAASGSLKKN